MTADETSFDTTPPPDPTTTGLALLKAKVVTRASASLLPLAQRVAPDHVGGASIDDAMGVARRLEAEGLATTVGYWDTGVDAGRAVADRYVEAVTRLSESGLNGYVSIKPPALRFDSVLAAELAEVAQTRRIRLHGDSHGPEVADLSCAMVETMLDNLSPDELGTTLPGRWSRSLADADWAIELGVNVRVVKGQWPDPEDPNRDMGRGCLEVVDRLAGRAHHVAVASHDLSLIADAIGTLRAADTSCELELIHGAPMAEPLDWARANDVAVRVYVPFGPGFIPNAVGMIRRNPGFAWRIVKGFVGQGRPTGRRSTS